VNQQEYVFSYLPRDDVGYGITKPITDDVMNKPGYDGRIGFVAKKT
jgi:hypothetical protein